MNLSPFPHSLSISSSFFHSLSIFPDARMRQVVQPWSVYTIIEQYPLLQNKKLHIQHVWWETQSIPNSAVETNRRVRSVWIDPRSDWGSRSASYSSLSTATAEVLEGDYFGKHSVEKKHILLQKKSKHWCWKNMDRRPSHLFTISMIVRSLPGSGGGRVVPVVLWARQCARSVSTAVRGLRAQFPNLRLQPARLRSNPSLDELPSRVWDHHCWRQVQGWRWWKDELLLWRKLRWEGGRGVRANFYLAI